MKLLPAARAWPVFGQVAAGLAHQPHRRVGGGLAQAGAQEGVVLKRAQTCRRASCTASCARRTLHAPAAGAAAPSSAAATATSRKALQPAASASATAGLRVRTKTRCSKPSAATAASSWEAKPLRQRLRQQRRGMRHHHQQAAHAAAVQCTRQRQQFGRARAAEGVVAAVAVALALEDDGRRCRHPAASGPAAAVAGSGCRPRRVDASGPVTTACTRWKRPATSASASSAEPSVPPAPTTSRLTGGLQRGRGNGPGAPCSACAAGMHPCPCGLKPHCHAPSAAAGLGCARQPGGARR
jgi:hypothetical protein